MFGGVKGLEASLEADENLNVEDPSLLFQHYLNTCPNQGSRTIRTEVRELSFIIWQVMKYREICIKYNQYLKKLYFHM